MRDLLRSLASRSLLLLPILFALSWSARGEIIPAGRRIDWSTAGTNIPSANWPVWTNMTSIDNTGATDVSAAVAYALSVCPAGQIVKLPAGTFLLANRIQITRNGVVLRGSGVSNTVINYIGPNPAIEFAPPGGEYARNLSFLTSANMVSGYTKGSTSITFDTTALNGNLVVGQDLLLDQLNDGYLVNNAGLEGACTYCSRANGTRALTQLARVAAVSGGTVTLDVPMYWTYSNSLVPQISWWQTPSVNSSGLEDLQIIDNCSNPGSGSYTVQFYGADYCWARNIQTELGDRAHVGMFWAYHCVVRDSYFTLSRSSGSQSYGVEISQSTCASLIENNRFYNLSAPIMFGWAISGNVIAYNYLTNVTSTPSTWMPEAIAIHDAHVMFNLLEGNYTPTVQEDVIHGSSSHNTLFRNRSTGWQAPSITGNGYAINVNAGCLYGNFVGNVLGVTNGHPIWIETNAVYDVSIAAIWSLGYTNLSSSLTGYDTRVAATALMHGNWDCVSNSVTWDPTITDHTIPPSLYLSAKPAWFGDRPWPPFDPLTATAASMDPTNLPSGYQFLYGVAPATSTNQPPVAVATATPTSGLAPLAVAFSSNGSYDPSGVALSYLWTFGDGTTSTAANPLHTYQTVGSYSAQLQVSNGRSSAVSSLIRISATNAPTTPSASATATPTTGLAPLTVNFSSAGSSSPTGATLSYNWNFGDGSTSTAANPSHTYQAAGSFVAQLTVSDSINNVAAAPITITASVPNPPPVQGSTNGLVAAYGFEEGSGTTVSDGSGNGNTGTVLGATWTPNGKYGYALSFTSGSYITINDSPSLDLTAALTLEAWVNPTALSTSWSDLIYKAPDNYFLMGTTPQGQLADMGGTFASGNVYATNALPLNTWSHVAATYDGTTMRFYVNGVQVSSRPQTGLITPSTGALSIGGDASNGQYWTGLIDEVRVYSRALGVSEIQSDMVSAVQRPTAPSGLRVVSHTP